MKFDLAKKENGEYEQGAVQSKWLWFLAGCKTREAEIDELKLSQPIYSRREIENKLKSHEQEIERLKNRVKELGFNNDYVEEVENKNWERDELIKEFLRLMLNTSMYFASEDARNVCDRARKMVGENGN